MTTALHVRRGGAVALLGLFASSTASAQASAPPPPPPPAQSAAPAPEGAPPAGADPSTQPGVATQPTVAPEPAPATAPATSTSPPAGEPPPPAAEPPPPAQTAPPPGIHVAQPAPPPPVAQTRHYHDGFYLRMGVGGGHLWTSSTIEDAAGLGDATFKLNGSGLLFDLAVGGSPAPGLAIGGALMLQDAFEPSASYEGPFDSLISDTTATDQTLGFAMIGPMIDGFPDPDGGLHVGGSLGLALLGLADKDDNPAGGYGLSAWVGYLWWVSSQWSIGATARFTVASTGRKLDPAIGDSAETTRALGLSFTALYH